MRMITFLLVCWYFLSWIDINCYVV
jgi:hypothetical protein